MIKTILTCFATGLLLVTGLQSHAGKGLWQDMPGKEAPSKLPKAQGVDNYKLFALDQKSMRSFLFDLDESPQKAKSLLLPTPNGYREFYVWKTPMMEPGLAAKYPDIQTFTAVAMDDEWVTAKLDYTEFGFRAMVYNGNESYMINPYSDDPNGYYMVYRQSDFREALKGACELGAFPGLQLPGEPVEINLPKKGFSAKSYGSTRRAYRLAISCTGEYAVNAVGPTVTKAQALSKVISTVNRVNGIFEREMALTLNIINDNDQLIFTDPDTDPYTCNNNLGCLINEAQGVITSIAGAQNFDIGHILCTAGGGLAQLYAVCGTGAASGTSTSGGPDDYFTIIHEMGHQFGANHTFNANSGSCNSNGNPATAYEPGAGITIMAYAGLCAPNNVGTTEKFYHVHSLIEMSTFIQSKPTCGTTSQGMPVIALPNVLDSFHIPRNTPFELQGPVATPHQSNAAVTYSWQQYDLGNFGNPEDQSSGVTDGPLFRTFFPDTSRTQIYPSLQYIYDGTYTAPGQRLAGVERTVNFKLLARSIFQGWGTYNYTDSTLKLEVASTGPFRVTSQSTSETWNPGETKTVTWAVANTTQAPVNCGQVNIYLSTDDGATFPYLLVANAPNNGSCPIVVPNFRTSKARVKVKGTGNVFFDINKQPLTINGDGSSIIDAALDEALSVSPNPASDFIVINIAGGLGKAYTATLYNALGQKVWQGSVSGNSSIPVRSYAKGTYMLQLEDGGTGARTTKKVLLQ